MAEYAATWRDGYPDPAFDARCISGKRFATEAEAEAYGIKAFGDAYDGIERIFVDNDDEKPF